MTQKKLFLSFIIFAMTGILSSVNAKTIEVLSLSNFSTANPPASIKVQFLGDVELCDKTTIPAGATVQGNLVDVKSPKRLKRDASFSFVPTAYRKTDGESVIIHEEVKAKYTKQLDKKGIAKSAALGVGGFFVKGLSTGVAAVEGAIKNEEGNVLKSTAVSVYEASPVSYIEKGQDLKIENNQIFYLKFPNITEGKDEYD